MHRFFVAVFMSTGSYLGWWLGSMINLFGGVIFGALGAGIGLYLARRLQHDYLS